MSAWTCNIDWPHLNIVWLHSIPFKFYYSIFGSSAADKILKKSQLQTPSMSSCLKMWNICMIPVMQIIHAVKISSRFCYIHHRKQLAFKSDVQPVRIVPEVALQNPNPIISISNTHRSSAWPAVNVDGSGFATISEKEKGYCVYLYN